MHIRQIVHPAAAPLRNGPAQWPIFVLCWLGSGRVCSMEGREGRKEGLPLGMRDCSKGRSRSQFRQISDMPVAIIDLFISSSRICL